MKQEKFLVLKDMLNSGKLTVNLDTGSVYGAKGADLSKRKPRPSGYIQVILTHQGTKYSFYIHQIVVVAGGLDPTGMTVNHKNGNKQDNRFDNLEVVSLSANMKHAFEHGLRTYVKTDGHVPPPPQLGEKNGGSKLTTQQVRQIKHKLAQGVSGIDLAIKYGVSRTAISNIKRGKAWAHVTIPEGIEKEECYKPKKWHVEWLNGDMVR